jgi:hypothetical protein
MINSLGLTVGVQFGYSLIRDHSHGLYVCAFPLPCSRETGFYEQITLVQGLSLFFFDSIFGSVEGVTHLFSAVFLFAL